MLEGAVVSPTALMLRVVLMVGAPVLLGCALRRYLGERRRLISARSLHGMGVVALCGIALAIMDSLR